MGAKVIPWSRQNPDPDALSPIAGAAPPDSRGRRRLVSGLFPTPELRLLALRNGLTTQLEALDCMRDEWSVGDVTREELTARRAKARANPQPARWKLFLELAPSPIDLLPRLYLQLHHNHPILYLSLSPLV